MKQKNNRFYISLFYGNRCSSQRLLPILPPFLSLHTLAAPSLFFLLPSSLTCCSLPPLLLPPSSLNPLLSSRVVPVLVVLALFGGLSATTRLVSDANKCSCWCFPHLGNVLPYSHGRDEVSVGNYILWWVSCPAFFISHSISLLSFSLFPSFLFFPFPLLFFSFCPFLCFLLPFF